jgi:hypothetical protein
VRNKRLVRAAVAIGLATVRWATPSAQLKDGTTVGRGAVDCGRGVQGMKRYKFGADFLPPELKRLVYAYPVSR